MNLAAIHSSFAWVMIVTSAAVGVWCLLAYRSEALRLKYLWWSVIGAQGVVFVQVFLGVAHQGLDEVKPTDLHALYGFTTIFTIGALYAYRSQLGEKMYLYYGLGSLFIMGLGLRELVLV